MAVSGGANPPNSAGPVSDVRDEGALRSAICAAGRRLYARNLIIATDGNISVRLGPGRFLCTPSGSSLADMTEDDVLVVDAAGRPVDGKGKPTSELPLHLAAYEERPDMAAAVHAHPPHAVALSVAGLSLTEYVLPEIVYVLGGVPTAAYATPGTPEGARVIREPIRRCDAVILDRHGVVALGTSVVDALYKLEKVEHAAYTLMLARMLGGVRTLPPEEVEKLYRVRQAYGVSGLAYRPADGEGMT